MPLNWRIFGSSGEEQKMPQEETPRSPWTATEPGAETQRVESGPPYTDSPASEEPDPAQVIADSRQQSFAEARERLTAEPVYVGGLPGLHETGEILLTGAGRGADDDAGDHCEHCGGRIPGDHELLTELLGWLAPAGEDFVHAFYVELFEAAPSLRHLFPADIKIQEEKLLSAIASLLQLFKAGDSEMEQLNSALARFGRSHTRFDPAATIEEYSTVWTILSGVATRMLGDKLTVRHVAALRRAYEYAAGLMLAAQATARLKGTGRRRREI